MKRFITSVAAAVLVLVPTVALQARAENPREEAREHPRIARAIHEIEDAVAYMEAAPHDFGGHKAAAIQASREAVRQLREALAFRAMQDNKHGR